MDLAEIGGDLKVDMMQISIGCPEACLHCGFYDGQFKRDDLKIISLKEAELERRIRSYAGYFNKVITTQVNSEPLRLSDFGDFAELVYECSGTNSQVAAITHGVRSGVRKMRDRLENIVQLMRKKIIPVCVVSTDFARSHGAISYRQNYDSYLETLGILKDALSSGRVTISLQGLRGSGPMSIERVREMFDEILVELSMNDESSGGFVVDDRSYTKVGRAEGLGIDESEDCDVIPDPDFVKTHVDRNHLWRGLIDFKGKLLVQPNRPGKTYGDSVDFSKWMKLDSCP